MYIDRFKCEVSYQFSLPKYGNIGSLSHWYLRKLSIIATYVRMYNNATEGFLIGF